MAGLQKTIHERRTMGTVATYDTPTQRVSTKLGPLFRRLLTMSLAMGAGMAFFHLLVLLLRAYSSYATLLQPGTDLYSIGMAVFMTVPTWVAAQCGDGGHNAEANGGC
jgi:hypothetical protein